MATYEIRLNKNNNSMRLTHVKKTVKLVQTGRKGQKGDPGDPATNLVTSVNGKQGVVVLNNTDVGADASGAAAQALNDAKAYTDQEVGDVDTGVLSVTAGMNVTVDNTDPKNPIVSASGGGGGAVDSVNGQTGVVVLDADDIDDTSTTNKFVTSADLTKLSNTSGTNTGDQDLSGYALTSSLADVATSGDYDDLTNKPTIPTVPVTSVAGKTGAVTLDKSDVGLGNVDNTSDANKPVSTATQTALNGKANTSHTHPVTDLTATGRTSANFLRGDNTWATPTNTTYTEISEAEITTGTASTLRAISGRRAGFLKNADNHVSGTTNKVFTATEQNKLAGIEANAQVNTVSSVNSKTGSVSLIDSDLSVATSGDAELDYLVAVLTALASSTGKGSIVGNMSTVREFLWGLMVAFIQVSKSVEDAKLQTINTESGTTRTLALADGGSYIRLTNATECDVTVPDNTDVAFPIGTTIFIRSVGAGAYTLAGAGSVTVNPPKGGTLVLDGDVTLVKVATDEWDVIGATVAV